MPQIYKIVFYRDGKRIEDDDLIFELSSMPIKDFVKTGYKAVLMRLEE